MKRKKHEDKQNTKTNQWNHKDKTRKRELKDSVEAYSWFAVTGEQWRELRQGVAASGDGKSSGERHCVRRGARVRERELKDIGTKEWIYIPWESKNLA